MGKDYSRRQRQVFKAKRGKDRHHQYQGRDFYVPAQRQPMANPNHTRFYPRDLWTPIQQQLLHAHGRYYIVPYELNKQAMREYLFACKAERMLHNGYDDNIMRILNNNQHTKEEIQADKAVKEAMGIGKNLSDEIRASNVSSYSRQIEMSLGLSSAEIQNTIDAVGEAQLISDESKTHIAAVGQKPKNIKLVSH